MATGNRTLKLSILADVDELKKSLNSANKEVESSADKIADFGKKAALAFAAAGAAVTAFAVSAVKAAAEDEKARKTLEQTIRANTRATDEQIKGIDNYIDKQSIATATTDDVLRPALGRLIRSTNDVQKAQDLLNLSQEISVATGKPLEVVANALGKSFDGQNTALGKLGLGIDAATLKNKSHDEIMQMLTGTYKGFIDNEATNAEFKFRQLSIAVDQTKEKIGMALLPIVKEFADYLLATVVPNVQALAAGLTGDNGVEAGITSATEGAYEFGQQLRSTIKFVISIKDELVILGGLIGTVFVASKIASFITAINTLVRSMIALRTAAAGAGVATAFATGGTSVGLAAAALSAVAVTYGLSKFAAGGETAGNAAGNYDYSGGSSFTYGGATTGSMAGGGGGGFTGGGGGGGTSGGGTSGGGSSYDKMLGELKKTMGELKKVGEDQRKAQAQLDIANNIIFAAAMPDEDQLRAQRLAAITLAAMKAEDPAAFGITNNIYVSGAVVDPEGLNRVITDIQTQSASRGTVYTPFVP
jgi:hypothetical protein